MDISAERTKFEAALGLVPESLRASIKARFDTAVQKYQNAAAGAADKEDLAIEIVGIRRDVEAAGAGDGEAREWSDFSKWAIGAAVFGIFLMFFLYFRYLPADKYASIEGTRPILVFTLIISMLAFGGLMIAAALYGRRRTVEDLQNRFRLAREIFLVFSGIFGTIIGFYFGAADDHSVSGAPKVEVAFAEGQLTAAVTEGAEPFIGIITLKDETGGVLMTSNKRLLTYKIAHCPDGASVAVVDGRGQRTEAKVDCNAASEEGGATDNAATGTNNATVPTDNGANETDANQGGG
jgi:hypothetical protein